MTDVVQFSGGAGSFAAAHRVAQLGREVVLLCADTNSEHDDWYGFVQAAAESLDAELVILRDGRDIWDLADEQRMIPNTRADFCSRILKREPLRRWLDKTMDPRRTVVHFGFDWTEAHRLERARPHWEPWQIDAPMCWDPVVDKATALQLIVDHGLPMPAAYDTGMPHNNCLKYGCVKGGQAYWRRVLEQHPDAYRRSEQREQQVRVATGKDVSILRDRSGTRLGRGSSGNVKPLTLKRFRERIQSQPALFDPSDWGACSCMSAPDSD